MKRSTLTKPYSIVLLLTSLMGLLLVPAQAQDDGRGVAQFAGSQSVNIDQILASLIFPSLFGVEGGKAVAVEALPMPLSDEVLLHLSPERTWSDGTPISAYDVLFSLLAMVENESSLVGAALREIAGVRIVDAQTIALRYAMTDDELAQVSPDDVPVTPTCDDLPRSNILLTPSHFFAPDFREFVENHAPEGSLPGIGAWREAYREYMNTHVAPSLTSPFITGGSYRLTGENDAHLVPVDGTGAALETITNLPPSLRPGDVTAFIAGDIDLLFNPPFEYRAALRALADPNGRNLQIADIPGQSVMLIQLNFANPLRPLPGFHPETGEPLDQGEHPIFSDLRVRQALQLGIDQEALIDGVFQQSATRLSGLLPPASWAYDPTLEPIETDIAAANQLLEDAGWHDSNGDGIRECIRCQFAEQGALLYIRLGIPEDTLAYRVADELADQWARIGVYTEYIGGHHYALMAQTFDAHLVTIGGALYEDADPDRSRLLTPAGDTLNSEAPYILSNYGSYNNPEVTRLVEAARTVPDCDIAARRAIYHELERVVQQDLPFLFVAAPNEFYAAAPNVTGFAPRAGNPLWNVESWVVSP